MNKILSPQSVLRFENDGFLRVGTLTTQADIAYIRSLLDPLFNAFDKVPKSHAVDLSGKWEVGRRPLVPEINWTLSLEPALRKTIAYRRCRELAREILRAPVGYVFDHAIYKPPRNEAPTHWHQDDAYAGRPVPLRTVHFWIPLQPVTVENGCMCFVPGSHRHGLKPHVQIAAHPLRVLTTTDFDRSTVIACPLEIGGATLHHPLTLHYTGANQTDKCRRVWIIHFGAYGRLGVFHPRNLLTKLRTRVFHS